MAQLPQLHHCWHHCSSRDRTSNQLSSQSHVPHHPCPKRWSTDRRGTSPPHYTADPPPTNHRNQHPSTTPCTAQLWDDFIHIFFDHFEPLQRGYVVIAPLAPSPRDLFFLGAERLIAPLITLAAHSTGFTIEGGKVHVIGASNGGNAAFCFNAIAPHCVASLVILSGIPFVCARNDTEVAPRVTAVCHPPAVVA